MNAEQFAAKLESLDACTDAKAWAEGKTLSDAWRDCPRPDWMLWLLGRSTVGKRVIATLAVEFADQCDRNASRYPAVAECIAVTRRFLDGLATQAELSAAMSAARSAAWAAARSAESAARSAWSAAWSAAAAARSAAWAARSAAWSAAESAWSAAESESAESAEAAAESAESAAARSAARSAQCDIIRRHVPDITEFLS